MDRTIFYVATSSSVSSVTTLPEFSVQLFSIHILITRLVTMSKNSQPEPDWSKVPLSDEITWTDVKSANGRTFKVGVPKGTPITSAEVNGPADNVLAESSKQPFDITVNWTGGPPPQGFSTFKTPTAQETQITSITRYNLQTSGIDYNEFSFSCTETYNFYFYDKTGDYYQVNVFWARPDTLHYVSYFSSDPTIVRVTGS
ncbi:hypothetical protein BDP67DRAFT_567962 [Colletotrichum lupini]|nr:hypothetical protein BDP67DRAFT_567962 [Colletotrichum lupini]